MKCTCGGEMQPGFVPDFGMFAAWTAVWLPGEPSMHKSVWDRIKTGAGISTEVIGQAKMLEGECCNDCGKVQLYARKPAPRGATPV